MRQITNAVLQLVAYIFLVIAMLFGIVSGIVLLPSIVCKVIGESVARIGQPSQSDLIEQIQKIAAASKLNNGVN